MWRIFASMVAKTSTQIKTSFLGSAAALKLQRLFPPGGWIDQGGYLWQTLCEKAKHVHGISREMIRWENVRHRHRQSQKNALRSSQTLQDMTGKK
jgi:hypothetical protein